jgi:hypothetical protein
VSQLEGVVVLGARFTRRPGAVIEREYRGSAHRLNWFGAGGEVVMVLNEALSDVVRRIGNDVPQVCGPARSGAKALPTGIEHTFQATPAVHQAGSPPLSTVKRQARDPWIGAMYGRISSARCSLTCALRADGQQVARHLEAVGCTHPPRRSW